MSLMNEIKAEIVRLARKEIKKELETIKRVNATQRGLIASLRRDLNELQKETIKLRKERGKASPEEPEENKRFWMSGKGVASLRKRLGITQAEMASLADVSTQTVVKWEQANGKIAFRRAETADLMKKIRAMGKREVRSKLESEAE